MFDRLLKLNCWSKSKAVKKAAANLLEKFYCCEINCIEIDRSVLFAHHARGCTVISTKICENVVIYQNVTIGSNMRYNKTYSEWEDVGNPIIGKNVIIADEAKVLGPVIIGENSVIGAGAIVTKDMPAGSVAYGVNRFKPKDTNYDLVFNPNMPDHAEIIKANNKLRAKFENNHTA
jgi:serine O-acetyltransferase